MGRGTSSATGPAVAGVFSSPLPSPLDFSSSYMGNAAVPRDSFDRGILVDSSSLYFSSVYPRRTSRYLSSVEMCPGKARVRLLNGLISLLTTTRSSANSRLFVQMACTSERYFPTRSIRSRRMGLANPAVAVGALASSLGGYHSLQFLRCMDRNLTVVAFQPENTSLYV